MTAPSKPWQPGAEGGEGVSPAQYAISERLRSATVLLEKLGHVEDEELQAAIAVIRRKCEDAAVAIGGSAEPEPLCADVYTLTAAECDTLLGLAAELVESPSTSAEAFCRHAHRLGRRMPEALLETLADFAFRGSRSGTLLLDALPLTDPLPPTPGDNKQHLGEKTVLARVQAVVNHACGQMVSYEAEGYGRLYQDMVPNRAQANSQTSLGSGVELELHTEQAFSKIRPDVLSLACLRSNAGALTYALSARVLLEHLSPDEQALLRQPLWVTGVDMSFKMNGHAFLEGDVRGPLPILGGADDDPLIVFDQDLMKGITDEAQAMLGRIIDIYKRHRTGVVLKPGQILLVDNVRAVHGRSPYAPNFDGQDRFIVRSFAVRDLVRTRYARPAGGRAMAAQFS